MCVDEAEGPADVRQREYKLELLFAHCVCLWVCVCRCVWVGGWVPAYTVSFRFSTLVVPQL